ncbi:helix-turn-helix domain-containing protein [Clostridium sp.]|uniref:helix-turn-helix domain-containing protein n=1 Tax=Clostridium sp. TaxID=1506 RepID=UPI0026281BCB|nr:helix-turn-helix domain-containing protein [Clostridium sp.]
MDNKDTYLNTQNINYSIQNKERGAILYYSIDQVADLLSETISNIKYYTNIFYDFLNIEIIDKELRYTNNDVDKLIFLIKLKNKGMSIKEIQDHYNKLPLSDTEVQHPKGNSLSIEELIISIKEEQRSEFNNLKLQLIDDIQNSNSLYIENITSTIIDVQNKSLNDFKQDLYKEIKEYLNSKFNDFKDINADLHNKLIIDTNELISKRIDLKGEELQINFKNELNTLIKPSLDKDDRLINEIKDLKGIMLNAYYTQSEIEIDNSKVGFWDKLFKLNKVK